MKETLKELFLKNKELIIKQLINFVVVFIASFLAISWALDLRNPRISRMSRYKREMTPPPPMPYMQPGSNSNNLRPPMPSAPSNSYKMNAPMQSGPPMPHRPSAYTPHTNMPTTPNVPAPPQRY